MMCPLMFPIFKPFALLLTAHLLGDVFFTSYRLSLLKRSSTGVTQVLGIALHCCVHALFAGILLILADRLWLRGAVLVFVFHFSISALTFTASGGRACSQVGEREIERGWAQAGMLGQETLRQ